MAAREVVLLRLLAWWRVLVHGTFRHLSCYGGACSFATRERASQNKASVTRGMQLLLSCPFNKLRYKCCHVQ